MCLQYKGQYSRNWYNLLKMNTYHLWVNFGLQSKINNIEEQVFSVQVLRTPRPLQFSLNRSRSNHFQQWIADKLEVSANTMFSQQPQQTLMLADILVGTVHTSFWNATPPTQLLCRHRHTFSLVGYSMWYSAEPWNSNRVGWNLAGI